MDLTKQHRDLNLSKSIITRPPVEVGDSTKILGLYVSNDFKWNKHVRETIKKAHKGLQILSQLKRSNIGVNELVQFYITCIRPVLEYACQAFHDSLTPCLLDDLETIQKRTMKIIFHGFHMMKP